MSPVEIFLFSSILLLLVYNKTNLSKAYLSLTGRKQPEKAPKQLEYEDSDELEAAFQVSESEEALELFDQMLQGSSSSELTTKEQRMKAVQKISPCVTQYIHKWAEWLFANTHDGQVTWDEMSDRDFKASHIGASSKANLTHGYTAEVTFPLGAKYVDSHFEVFLYRTKYEVIYLTVHHFDPHWRVYGRLEMAKGQEDFSKELFKQVRMEAEQGVTVSRMKTVFTKLDKDLRQ